MKKLLCLILSMALLCLVGCGSDKDNSSSGNEKSGMETAVASGTIKEAKYSPYVSDMAPNPFLIPLENLVKKGWLYEKTLAQI